MGNIYIAIGAGVPTGTIIPWPSNTPPKGWLICDGSAVSRTTYARLFALIGTRFGAGDGSTTFNLPDLRGRVPVGLHSADSDFDTIGKRAGSKTHVLTIAELPVHNHGGSTALGGLHTHTGETNFAGSHSHDIIFADGIDSEFGAAYHDNGYTLFWGSDLVSTAGSHTHTVTIDSNGSHTHSISSQGGGQAHNNLQPYIVLNFIIKT